MTQSAKATRILNFLKEHQGEWVSNRELAYATGLTTFDIGGIARHLPHVQRDERSRHVRGSPNMYMYTEDAE